MSSKLAIDGGKPLRAEPYPPWPHFCEEEKGAVREVLDSGKVNYWTGFRGMEFQKQWAEYCGVKHAIAVNSGTSALHVAVAAAGIGPGDEVICPSYTFIGTAAAVLHQNAIPIFVDVDERTYNIDPTAAEQALTPRTKAIIAVHLHGHPAEMDPLLDLARRRDLVVIEDAAQAHGAEYKGRKIGSIGHLAAFSFCQDKIITTGGEGGMVTTDSDEFAEIGRSFKDHGYWEEEHKDLLQMEALYPYIHHRLGFNYRMTEMQSVIGMAALKHLDQWVDKRRDNAHYLGERIRQIPQLEPPYEAPHVKHAFYKYALRIKPETLKCGRDDFIHALRAEGIPCGAGVPPANQMEEVFRKHVGYGGTNCPFACPWYGKPPDYGQMKTPVAETIAARTVWLLVHPTVERKDLDDVAAALEKVAGAYAV